MQISDWINTALCILSLILAIISVITVVITLRQNAKMMESSTRPYISIYGAVTNFQDVMFYIVIRNFGQSAATITLFNIDFDLSQFIYNNNARPFEHIVGTTLAPNQSLQYPINHLKLFKSVGNHCEMHFNIAYKSANKSYTDASIVNLSAYTDFSIMRANTKDSELKIISYTLQDIAERIL